MWEGGFGQSYTDSNFMSTDHVDAFWLDYRGVKRTELNEMFLSEIDCSARILEVGTNRGNQLLLLQEAGFTNLYGIEPMDYAIGIFREREQLHKINIIKGTVFDLPFKNNFFDIVFTSGVLIHIAPEEIQQAMVEIHRCSKEYIWGFEYFADEHKEVMCRGHDNLLWKADFVKLYLDSFADLKLIREKRIKNTKGENIDTMFLLKKET